MVLVQIAYERYRQDFVGTLDGFLLPCPGWKTYAPIITVDDWRAGPMLFSPSER